MRVAVSAYLVALVVALGGVAAAQDGSKKEAEETKLPPPLILPRLVEHEATLQRLQAGDRARARGDDAVAALEYGAALRLAREGGVIVVQEADPKTKTLRRARGAIAWATERLRALGPKGVKAFRTRYDAEATKALERALAENDLSQALERAYTENPLSTHAVGLLKIQAERVEDAPEEALPLWRTLLQHHADEVNVGEVRKHIAACEVAVGPVEAAPRGHLQRGSSERTVELGAKRFSVALPGSTPRALARGGRIMPGALPEPEDSARRLPLVHGGQVLVVGNGRVRCFDSATGKSNKQVPLAGAATYANNDPKFLFSGAISGGRLVGTFVSRVLRNQSYRGIPIKLRQPIYRLAAFDLTTRRWAWAHREGGEKDPTQGWSFPAPPVVHEGRVYAPAIEHDGPLANTHVVCFSLRTGELLWTRWTGSGSVDTTMFGDAAGLPLCTPVTVAGGVVYHSTSVGLVAALDAASGRLLWLSEYQPVEVRAPRGYYSDGRNLRAHPDAPLFAAGVLVVAPLDSNEYYGFDPASGEILWTKRRRRYAGEAEMRYVMGAADGRVVLGGGHHLVCVQAKTGKLYWKAPLRGRNVAGRGWITGSTVWVSTDRGELSTFALVSGKRLGRYEVGASGNVVVHNGVLVVAGAGKLVAYSVNE